MDALWQAAEGFGWRVNAEAGTIDGLTESGVAFRALPREGLVKLAVRMAEKKCPKLQARLTENPAFAELTVTGTDNGIELRFPMTDIPAAVLKDVIEAAARFGVELASESFNNKLESGREPAVAYLRGAAGALLGAIVGALPWFLVQWFVGWNMWYLGALVGIASFFGYSFLWGAHSTRFALGAVIVSSLLATTGFVVGAFFLGGDYAALVQVYAEMNMSLTAMDIVQYLGGELFGSWLCCAVGLFGIRGRILAYTHEHTWLRGRRK